MQKNKIESLPKWAQAEIKSLKIKIKELEKTLEVFFGKRETNIYVCSMLKNYPLPNNAQVKFMLNHNEITLTTKDNKLCVMAIGEISIIPRAANSIYIKPYE